MPDNLSLEEQKLDARRALYQLQFGCKLSKLFKMEEFELCYPKTG